MAIWILPRELATTEDNRAGVLPLGMPEALAREHADVVRQPDREQHQDEREADHPGALHGAVGHRPAADLLHYRPEDVTAVERQEREQVHDRERERDDGH